MDQDVIVESWGHLPQDLFRLERPMLRNFRKYSHHESTHFDAEYRATPKKPLNPVRYSDQSI